MFFFVTIHDWLKYSVYDLSRNKVLAAQKLAFSETE